MPRAPRDPVWRKFCARYVDTPGFWYIPKGETVKSIERIQARLGLLRERFSGKHWTEAQLPYVNALRKNGLFSPRGRSRDVSDRTAIARMIKVVYHTLGLAWVDQEDAIFISPAGERFLDSSEPEAVLEAQLWKYQFWNPTIPDDYREFRLFPYPFLLRILLNFPDGISVEEYNLFVSRARTSDSLSSVLREIRRWRALNDEGRARIVAYLDSIPAVSAKARERVSLYERIARCQSYAWALFSSPGCLSTTPSGLLALSKSRIPETENRLREFELDSTFIEFENEKDWFTYFGDITAKNSYATAMSIYEERYDVEKAVQAMRSAKERSLVEPSLTEEDFREEVVREKVIEDILEHRLDLLEEGLVLHVEDGKRGRQFATERGRIDLLARDKDQNWVVIELKRERAGDKVIGQTLRYLGWVRQNRLRSNEHARGFIVGKPIDRNLIAAAMGAAEVPLKLFEFDFKLGVAQRYPPVAAPSTSPAA